MATQQLKIEYRPISAIKPHPGSTLIACEQTGRVGYGCELAPQYVDATIRRWQHLTGRQALLNGATLDEVEVQRTKGASRKAKK